MLPQLTAKATIGIQKPIHEIFEAIIHPEKMTNFFISKSSGTMQAGSKLQWSFPEFDGSYPVSVKEVVPDEKIIFVWDPQSVVTITLEKKSDNDTVVKLEETGRRNNEEGIKWVIGQTEGWANFVACMKAYLEYGIHLRKGAFDFMNNNPN